MLLRHTTKEIKERKALTVNPAKTCQPIGAMYAALGVHGCFPHSHGSQGCCAYHRSALTRHYKEPIMAGTSSFTEGASVFGGQSNLLQSFDNIFTIYDPEIIAVHSTCLSETIGDDMGQIVLKAINDGKVPEGKRVVYASTPSYIGSHITGFSSMTESLARQLAEKKGSCPDQYNIIPGWVEPSDMREIKRLCNEMGLGIVMFPDTSDVLDAPMTGKHEFYPRGGTTIDQIKSSGDSRYTFALGPFASEAAAKALSQTCQVDYKVLELPIGLKATDRFLMALREQTGADIPYNIEADRGRLVDIICDMQQYFYGKRVALFGDPDQLVPLTEFLLDLDMIPAYIISGTPGKIFTKKIKKLGEGRDLDLNVKNGKQADMYLLHQWIKNEGVDLLIGNTYGKYIARDEDIPFVRFGFPVLDRIGHSYFPITGYQGGMRLLEKILSALMDKMDRSSLEESFELVM